MKRSRCHEAQPLAGASAEKLPAKTLLYRCVARAAPAPGEPSVAAVPPPEPGELLSLVPPEAAAVGARVCEYALLRHANVARCSEPPTADALCHGGCDGWLSVDGSHVMLLSPSALLRLTDDDKQAGRVQAFITDMFARRSWDS